MGCINNIKTDESNDELQTERAKQIGKYIHTSINHVYMLYRENISRKP